MYKVVTIDKKEFTIPSWIKTMGREYEDRFTGEIKVQDYNYLPEPWVEITEDEYWHFTRNYEPKYIDFRQVWLNHEVGLTPSNSTALLSTFIYWFHDRAIAVIPPNRWDIQDGKVHWTERPRFIRIGCLHDNKESKQVSMHYREWKCLDCGYSEGVDSSD